MRRISTTAASAFACCLLLVGCSDDPDDSSSDTGSPSDTMQPDVRVDTTTDTAPTDTEAPELRDISAAIQGEFSSQVDLNNEDVTRVLPVAADAEFTIFASDNETDPENLTVEVVGAEGEALEVKNEEFRNGLWRITVELAPGTDANVRVTDGAGNTATSEQTLSIPSLEQALVDDWQRRGYDDQREITTRWNRDVLEDGTWEEARGQVTFGGDWTVEDGTLEFAETYREGGETTDSDRETVEQMTASSFYVDETYFHHRAWTRDGESDGEGVAGTWTRSFEVHEPRDGELQLAREVEETIEFQEVDGGDNTWTLTRTGTDYTGGGETAIDETESGTWQVIENESYAGNYGDFLVRETTEQNGESVDNSEPVTELFTMPLDKLLISPYLRSPEAG
jgi:hypothetical protein